MCSVSARFAHPTGRAIDQQQTPAPQAPVAASPYALNPALLPQYMQLLAQPQSNFPSAVGPPAAPYSSSITKPITSSNLDSSSSSSHSSHPTSSKRTGGGPAVCRYGRECHRDGCYFVHPEGRLVDERRGSGVGAGGRSSPSDDEVADALDEFEAANGLTEEEEDEAAFRQYKASMGAADDDDDFVCPCCNGRPAGCTNTSSCQRAGICACQADRIEDGGGSRTSTGRASGGGGGGAGGGVDDTWKDEWFADSRLCDCCHGYVYRCERQQPTCEQGKCYCSAHLNGAHVQQPAGV